MTAAKQLMDEFHAESERLKKAGEYGAAFVFDNAESLVNNVMHGQPFEQTATAVRAALVSNSLRQVEDGVLQQVYLQAVDLLDLFVSVYELERDERNA